MSNSRNTGLFRRALAVAAACAATAAAGFSPHQSAALAQVPAPGVLVAVDDTADPVLPGTQVAYALEVTNFSDEPLAGVVVETATPEGTTFEAIFASTGEWTVPANGEAGPIEVAIAELAPNQKAFLSFGFAVEPGAPARLDFAASVRAATGFALDLVEPTFVAEAGAPILRWELFDRPAGAPGDAPRYLRVDRVVDPLVERPAIVPDLVLPGAEYRLYRSREPGVAPSAENLVMTLPATQAGTGPIAAEPGYFYAVTSVVDGAESAASNEVSFGAGEPVVERLRVKGSVLTATGAGFEEGATVSVGPLTFEAPAKVKAGGTRLKQGGRLSNGMTLRQVARPGRVTFFVVRNPGGGTTGVLHGATSVTPRF